MEIQHNRANRTIFIHQKSNIDDIPTYFGMNQAKSVSVPADPHTILRTKNDNDNNRKLFQII